MPDVLVVSVLPTWGVPLIVGRPVGALFSGSGGCSGTAAGVAAASAETGPSPAPLVARTRSVYWTSPVSPVIVWPVPVTVACETSAGVSQLAVVCFHSTV